MIGIKIFSKISAFGLSAVLMAGVFGAAVFAATPVVLRNNGPDSVQIGFDNSQAMTIMPRGTARTSLEPGEHTAQCKYAGGYDGCNLAENFTVGSVNEMVLNLQPVYFLGHALTLARQGMLSIETRADGVWATNTTDIDGTAEDCASYEAGKLGAVSRRMKGRITLRNVSLVTRNYCGDEQPAIAADVDGGKLYFPLRFVSFRERSGRLILVSQ